MNDTENVSRRASLAVASDWGYEETLHLLEICELNLNAVLGVSDEEFKSKCQAKNPGVNKAFAAAISEIKSAVEPYENLRLITDLHFRNPKHDWFLLYIQDGHIDTIFDESFDLMRFYEVGTYQDAEASWDLCDAELEAFKTTARYQNLRQRVVDALADA